jgi:hypothetical protein
MRSESPDIYSRSMIGRNFETWPMWLQYAVGVPHALLLWIMFWLWWPKSVKEWQRFFYVLAYLIVFYLIFVRK